MEKDVKIFFEDLLKKENLSGPAMVAVNTSSNQIFVDIEYPNQLQMNFAKIEDLLI